MKRLSWKYIAGLVDGEGCIDFQCHTDKRNKVQRLYLVPRLRVAMAENASFVLKLLEENHGGKIWQDLRSRYNPNWSNAAYWQLQGKKMRPFLQNLIKHLLIKKEQAKLAMWWIDNVMGMQPPNGHYDEKLPIIRQCARDELKAMKKDPQRLSERAVLEIQRLMR